MTFRMYDVLLVEKDDEWFFVEQEEEEDNVDGGKIDQYSLRLPLPIVQPQSSRLRLTERGLVNP